ncbi:undecaprenyldiphospho-muramoylpentapeptide beta-N-acetylglucosaminyltransferase [Sinomonas notoginsengisoli]|uniref:undecaprenyldiphospho-muramoylpentapeptide beta-N-acetylglucosaminyltransferase n=1 Tax=Sinomonas notoginsengisoli TaxID=1457311 RepID=UPI001F1AA6AB|nr:undecaprenyldiphospho-muramoylpentapeptide beta-N-acetylglucosaminyltransferase [Sinomonas notoginsengisoli]
MLHEDPAGTPAPVPPLSVVLAGGGTAGHISPLLAIARAVLETAPEARILAVGTASGMETRLVPDAGFRLAVIDRVPLPRKPTPDLFRLPARFVNAVRQSEAILDSAAADVLVGVGGYVCTPMYLAARRRGVPIVIHEANTRAGLANRVGALFTKRVGKAFPDTRLRHSRLVGMPMRREITALDRGTARRDACARLGLDPDTTTLVVTGGSLGAASLNRTITASLEALGRAGVQTLHITGRGKAVTGPEGLPLSAPGYRQVEFVDGMESAYAAADLILCRSGAGTVCEVAAVGLPGIFVPLPIGNGEQALNARGLVEAGAAIMVRDADFTAEWLAANVLPLLRDQERLAEMSRRASEQGVRDADIQMAAMVMGAAQGRIQEGTRA